jgi:hypothetical protein
MALAIDTTTRSAQLSVLNDAFNAGAGPATITIYAGSRPATGGAETTPLVTLTFTDPAFVGPITGGNMTADTITGAPATGAGTQTATWFRVKDSTSAFVMDGDVGTSGSDLNLNTDQITNGVQVDITQMILTAGNA